MYEQIIKIVFSKVFSRPKHTYISSLYNKHNKKKILLSEKDNFVKKNLISLVQAFLQQDNRFIIVVPIPTKRGSRNAQPHLFSHSPSPNTPPLHLHIL